MNRGLVRQRPGLSACLICFAIALPMACLAQTPPGAPLPPAAREAIQNGILAAGQKDFLLAATFFQDARRIAPQSPEIYYDLGLAESRIPGREVRAICWFGAYLAASPAAPDASAVKDQVRVLNATSQSNVLRLLRYVQSAARQVPGDKRLIDVVLLSVASGDTEGAQSMVGLMADESDKQAARGFIEDRQSVTDVLRYARELNERQDAQTKNGDVAGAQKTADILKFTGSEGYIRAHPIQADTTVGAWLRKLDDDDERDTIPLNTELFLDPVHYMASMPVSGSAQEGFHWLVSTAFTTVGTQLVIGRMLK